MKQISVVLSMAGILHTTSSPSIEIPMVFTSLVKQLQTAPNYSWLPTTEMSDAPFNVAPVVSTTDTNGFAVVTSDVEKIIRGHQRRRARAEDQFWLKNIAVLNDVKDPNDRDLLATKFPPDKLATIAAKLSHVKSADDNTITGELNAESAKAYLLSSMKGSAPSAVQSKCI